MSEQHNDAVETQPGRKALAVVTGASSGIGLELARELAEHGHDLVLCAEDDAIHGVADELSAGDVSAEAVQLDLRGSEAVREFYAKLIGRRRPVEVFVLNAGVGRGEAFVDQPVEDILSIVALNVASTTLLARLALPDMIARDSGRMLITSSIASTMPGAYQAVYNASKSYLQSLIQALQRELTNTNITLTSLMPGPTETNFFDRAHMASSTLIGRGKKDDARTVAAQGYEALMAGQRRVIGGGVSTRVQYLSSMVTPDRAKAALHAVMARPRRHEDGGS